jgi:hypothetical protein
VTDDLEWLTALPAPVRAALLADPGAALPPDLIARLPRLVRATYGTDDPSHRLLDAAAALRGSIAGQQRRQRD